MINITLNDIAGYEIEKQEADRIAKIEKKGGETDGRKGSRSI